MKETSPFYPVRMHPAFRSGRLTPWGGERLRTVYGKAITEVPTGESLEVSCIQGLESTDDNGEKLTDLIARYGEDFAGAYAHKPFPLLLKLIDAAESLSVQVHPDDAYAGSKIVYGIKAGTTAAQLRTACEAGAAVEPLLRRVNVKPGDVCFIPAGCVHAIGAGILLYEIQQSSDVTYRFYDWDRVDARGQRRELHIDKALDVMNLRFALKPIHASDKPVERVLDEAFFTLDLFNVRGACRLPAINEFGLLTVLDDGLTLTAEGYEHVLSKGESFYLPTRCPALTLRGSGRAALSMPH